MVKPMLKLAVGALLAFGISVSRDARADGVRFGVGDISSIRAPDALLAAVERDVARLRPGFVLVDEPAIRRAMATGETADVLARHLLAEAAERKAAGDCATAVVRAAEAEDATLGGVPIDEERDALKAVYALLVACEHQLGHPAEAKAAGARLRSLVSLPPTGLPRELWDQYAGDAAPSSGPGAATGTELQIDSDPPNARVAVNSHGEGVTPLTLKVPPGIALVEVEKDEYKKAFRRVAVGRDPVRTVFRLTERSRDRIDAIRTTIRRLRGSDPTQHKLGLSRLCQLGRLDLLVVVQVTSDRAKIWFFDPERGDLADNPIDSHFDPVTGRVDELAARATPVASPAPVAPIVAPTATAPTAPASPPANAKPEGLPEAQAEDKLVPYNPTPWIKDRRTVWRHWYSWVIAAAAVAGIYLLVRADQPTLPSTLEVHAHWKP